MFWPGAITNLPSQIEALPSPTPLLVEVINQAPQSSFFDTVVAGIIAGATAGIFIVLLQVLGDYALNRYLKRRDGEANRLVRFPHEERYIDAKIFDHLQPGRSVEYMKTVLGPPAMTQQGGEPEFRAEDFHDPETYEALVFASDDERDKYSERFHQTTSYVYHFQNAIVKTTSKDREVIDSLAVQMKPDQKLTVPLPLGWSEENESFTLGEAKVTRELVEECSNFSFERSRYEFTMALCLYTAAPLYTYYTYFGTPENMGATDEKPDTFIGGMIDGICLHALEYRCYIIHYSDYE